MLPVLRIIGIANAALWFGATVFFLVCIRSGFQSEDMAQLLPGPFPEAALHIILVRYLGLLLVCSIVAVIQLWAEQWYAGRPIFRLRLGILLTLVSLCLILKYLVFPTMKTHHLAAHRKDANPTALAESTRSYRAWKTGFHFFHLMVLAGSFSHLWYISHRENSYRTLGMQQFRG